MRIEIYLPTVQQTGEPIAADVMQLWRGVVTDRFCKMWGGCSSHVVNGDWVDSEGLLHSEECRVVYSFGAMTAERAKELNAIAQWVADDCNQAAVMVSVDGVAELISQTPKKAE